MREVLVVARRPVLNGSRERILRFLRLRLENWRNFLEVDVPLHRRVFLVGPNASGKSNLLDALRFLRDIADPRGGFQSAVSKPPRHSVSHLRSLHARRYPNVVIEVEVDLDDRQPWKYRIEFTQDNQRRPVLKREQVDHGQHRLLTRPNSRDQMDESLLTQTHLEQVGANRAFRSLQDFFSKIRYLHIVPQLVREPDRSVGKERDPFGGDFLQQVAATPKKTLDARLRRITSALQVAVPQLKSIELQRDARGTPHLRGRYQHWRPRAGWQTEDQFSDGTLRLLGLLWVLLDGTHPLLLEEPELSLHPGVIRYLPGMMARLARKHGRQIFVSTHSADLLSDLGIGGKEVLLLEPTAEDTKVAPASGNAQIRALLNGGAPMSEAVLPRLGPCNAEQLLLFADK